MRNKFYYTFILFLFFCCSSENQKSILPIEEKLYFPPISDNNWETKTVSSLNWNSSAVKPLLDFLEEKNTKSFILLVNGKIVFENYFNDHEASETWEWNSAGKTLCTATIGIAQQENLIKINNKVSDYLGEGWTNMALEKEQLITVKNLLTMTSGIDDTKQLIIKSNLNYVADAGSRWAYGNVFQKLINVVSESSNEPFETYFNEKLKHKIGMDGYWNFGSIFSIYHSTARSMARFGLLALNKGKWNEEQIVNESFFKESITSSQGINPSYGYLWWLNGKSKYMIPSEQTIYTGALVKNAPSDMYAAMGAKDQRIYVIPSKKMVVVRMGEVADPENPTFGLSYFDNELWLKINDLYQ